MVQLNIEALEKEEPVDSVEYGEFKGNKIISLNPASGYGFSFGKNKAKLIVKFYDEIKKFAEVEE